MQQKFLHSNGFRRKPAIAKLDKPFTPNHESSESFAQKPVWAISQLYS